MQNQNHPIESEKPYDFYLSEEFLEKFLPDSEYRSLLKTDEREFHLILTLIEKRFLDLEEKIFRKKQKNSATKTQKLLLLKHLGILDNILALEIPLEKKYFLLSLIIDSSQDNIKKDVQSINYSNNPTFYTKENLNFLADVFTNAGLPNHLKEIKKSLNITKTKGKKRK